MKSGKTRTRKSVGKDYRQLRTSSGHVEDRRKRNTERRSKNVVGGKVKRKLMGGQKAERQDGRAPQNGTLEMEDGRTALEKKRGRENKYLSLP